MRKFFIITCLNCITHFLLIGQNFTTYLHQGVTEYNSLNFQNAINNFKAAKISASNSVEKEKADNWIEKANQGFIDFMQNATLEANKAKEEADKAKVLAQREAAISEASRLSILSDTEIEEENYSDALILANLAIKRLSIADSLSPLSNTYRPLINAVNKTFGSAVNKNFTKEIGAHSERIVQINVSPDEKLILSVGRNKIMKLWDFAGNEIFQETFSEKLLYTTFSPSGSRILTCNANGVTKVFDIQGNIIANMIGHKEDVIGGTFSKKNNMVLTWSRDNMAKLWNQNGKLISTFPHSGNVYFAQFCPNGQYILTRSSDNTIKIWSLNGKLKANLDEHKAYIYKAIFLPNGQNVLSISADKTAIIWNLNGTIVNKLNHKSSVLSTNLSEKNNRIFTIAKNDSTIRVWNFKGNLVSKFKGKDEIIEGEFLIDGDKILYWTKNNNITILDVITGVETKIDNSTYPISFAKFSSNKELIYAVTQDNTLEIWDLQGKLIIALRHNSLIPPVLTSNSILSSKDGKILLVTPYPEKILQQLKKDNIVISKDKMLKYNLLNLN